jgi:hypothetical protein
MTKINISTGASVPGIHVGVVHPYNVGKMLATNLDTVAKVPDDLITDGKPNEKFHEWLSLAYPEFEISESQRQSVKAGFEKLVEKEGAINPDRYYVELAPLFGLIPE